MGTTSPPDFTMRKAFSKGLRALIEQHNPAVYKDLDREEIVVEQLMEEAISRATLLYQFNREKTKAKLEGLLRSGLGA